MESDSREKRRNSEMELLLGQLGQQQASAFSAGAVGMIGGGLLGGLQGGLNQIDPKGIPFRQDVDRVAYRAPNEMKIRFHRVNELVEIHEGAIAIKEPLDELRIEVAKWLN